MVCLPSKTNFSFASGYPNGYSFLLGMGTHVHLLSTLGPPSDLNLCAGLVHAAIVSEFICVSVLLCLEDTVSLV